MSARTMLTLIVGAALAAPACAALSAGSFGIDTRQPAHSFAAPTAAPDLTTLDEAYRLPAAAPAKSAPAVAQDVRIPSGMELTLGALASLGVLRGLRNLKKLPVGYAFPEWYAETAPRQIGHATPLDLDSLHILPACPLTPPLVLDPPVGEWQRALIVRGGAARRELLIETPRGPPAIRSA